jgi:hypothetical protein
MAHQRPALPISALSSNYRNLLATSPSSCRLVVNDREYYCKALKDFSVFEQINTWVTSGAPATGFVEFKQRDNHYIVTFETTDARFEIEDFIKDYIFSHERYGDV